MTGHREPGSLWVAALIALLGAWIIAPPASRAAPLQLRDVLDGVARQYPPYLASLIERDVAEGRLHSARAPFDFNVFAKVFANPTGYYDSTTVDAGFEQFTGIWGSTIFGGYKYTTSDDLPDYNKDRTQSAGEPRVGLRLPLLRDGSIDRRRTTLRKAELDRALADPIIQRQQIDFLRAANVAYFAWLSAGERLRLAERLLKTAEDRGDFLGQQASAGLIAPITVKDNQRLIVSRSLALVQARRRFEAAGLALSLFLRNEAQEPTVAGTDRLPKSFPPLYGDLARQLDRDVDAALERRPELRRIALNKQKLDADLRLARNQLLPNLDASVSYSQDVGKNLYKDKEDPDTLLGLEFKMPVQQREAEGRIAEVSAQIDQLRNEERFARDRISTEVRDAASAIRAALEQIDQARLNASLAAELQEAEAERMRRGASDLLALQIREQAAFDAQVGEVDALTEYFRAAADFFAATARPQATADK